MDQWNACGSYFETCSCDAACPCGFLSAPTKGECTVFAGWHIDQGKLGDVSLDGLNVAFAAHAPGHMMEVEWTAALYIDERADEKQKDALTRIFKGELGGQPARFMAHVGKFMGVKSVPIQYQTNAKHRSLKIPNIADAEIVNLSAEGVEEVSITSRPWSIVGEKPVVVAKSERFDFDDYGMQFHGAKESGYHAQFDYRVSA